MRRVVVGISILLACLIAYGLGAQTTRKSSLKQQWESMLGKQGVLRQQDGHISYFHVRLVPDEDDDWQIGYVSEDHVVFKSKPVKRYTKEQDTTYRTVLTEIYPLSSIKLVIEKSP